MGTTAETHTSNKPVIKTGKELLEIIEANYDVHSFAYDELTETHEKVELTEAEEKEAEKIGAEREAFYEKVKDNFSDLNWSEKRKHPDYITWSKMPTKYSYKRDVVTERLGLGPVVEVDQYGGEDMGSTWYSVKYFPIHDVYIRTDGYYQSYSGTDFHDGYGKVVTPQKKTITVFE